MEVHSTVVIEDEGPARRRLEKLVNDHPELELIASFENGIDAINSLNELIPDIVLFDIQLKDKTAFEIIEECPHLQKCKIIFITAYHEFAVKAFDLDAVDYLLKPFDEYRFNRAISRVVKLSASTISKELLSRLERSVFHLHDVVKIPEGNKDHFIKSKDVILVKADRYYVYIHSITSQKLIRITLKKMESLLPSNFIRVGKSTIININHITRVEKQKHSSLILMSNNEEVHVSENFNNKFQEQFPF